MRDPDSIDHSRQARGRWGEDLAVRHYQRLGYELVDRNWRTCRGGLRGELDVVVRRGTTLVFCEVKARRTAAYGGAESAVDRRKQIRVRRLAAAWLAEHDVRCSEIRFDVVAITGVELTLVQDAF